MKYTLFTLSLFLGLITFAQTNDSVMLGAGATDMVFYSLGTATKINASNMDWHIAFSVRQSAFPSNAYQGVSIRINEANGLKLFRSTQKLNVWSSFDTTGWRGWTQLHNPDTTWNIGAFNANVRWTDPYNFGWGEYIGAPTHNVKGDSIIYLIQMPDGNFRKYAILNCSFDTSFNVQFDRLDNSGFTTQEIRKRPYSGKCFVYYNLDTKTLIDKEPLLSAWDMVFLRYNNTIYNSQNLTQDMGVLTNDANWVESDSGAASLQNCPSGKQSYKINIIGQSYKDRLTNALIPDHAYFYSRAPHAIENKLTFTSQGSSYDGVIKFTINQCGLTEIQDIRNSDLSVSAYPVPTGDLLQVHVGSIESNSVSIFLNDITGRVLIDQSGILNMGENNFSLNTSAIQNGNYILSVSSPTGRSSKLISIAR